MFTLASTQDIVILISASATAIVSILGAIFAGLAALRAGQVHTAVQTSNGHTLGELVEKTALAQPGVDMTAPTPQAPPVTPH